MDLHAVAADPPASRTPPPALFATGLIGLGLTAAAVVITAASGGGVFATTARASMVAVPVAVGLYAWRSRPSRRFGRQLVAFGFLWFLTTLAESDNELVYSIGRVAGWFAEPSLVYLILAFPSGRLAGRFDRALVGAAWALVFTAYLPLLLFTQDFPIPSPYTSCTEGCPDNAFFVLGSEPGVDSVLLPLREALSGLLFLAVVGRLVQRMRVATPLMRRTLDPVLTVALLRSLALALALALRRAAPDSPALEPMVWMVALGLPLVALAFLAGLASWRVYEGRALEQLGTRVREGLEGSSLQAAVTAALGDPSLRIVRWSGGSGGHWVDAGGRQTMLPAPESGRAATAIKDGDVPVAALIHDAELAEKPEFLNAVASYASVAVQNERLAGELAESLYDVEESRARLLASSDAERRRIERDLHDGAQQRLVALRIQLELVEELIARDPQRAVQKVHRLGDEVATALDEIRTLARGVYPALLGDRGLAEALRAAALTTAVPASVASDGIRRYPQDVETAVYFCCLEAMQNASKHATGARRISVSLADEDGLRFDVRDDGTGFDGTRFTPGAGITNMRDRIHAVGGQLSIRSSESGTVVAGSVPV